mgnify:CR=1 FL=1
MKTLYEQSFSDDYSERKSYKKQPIPHKQLSKKAKHRVQENTGLTIKKSLPIKRQ